MQRKAFTSQPQIKIQEDNPSSGMLRVLVDRIREHSAK